MSSETRSCEPEKGTGTLHSNLIITREPEKGTGTLHSNLIITREPEKGTGTLHSNLIITREIESLKMLFYNIKAKLIRNNPDYNSPRLNR